MWGKHSIIIYFERTYCFISLDNITSFIDKITNKIDEMHIFIIIIYINLTFYNVIILSIKFKTKKNRYYK